MRSVLEVFGAIALATKDVQVYSADRLDWGTIDPRFLRAKAAQGTGLFHRTNVGEDACVVFTQAADGVAADGFIPIIQDSLDDSTYADCLSGQNTQTTFGAGVAIKKGPVVAIPLPRMHMRYMRASVMPKSTGVLTASSVTAFIEYGPNDN
jgi:hypothetical protein